MPPSLRRSPRCIARSLARSPRLARSTSFTFVSQASIDNGTIGSLGFSKRISAVKGCRAVGKKDMLFNDSMGKIEVDPADRHVVRYEGEELTCEPATVLPMAQRYFLF